MRDSRSRSRGRSHAGRRDASAQRLPILPLLILAGLLLLAPSVLLADEPSGGTDGGQPSGDQGSGGAAAGQPTTPPPAAAEPKKEESFMDKYENRKPLFGTYGKWIQHMEKMLLGADIWGNSATAPQGFLLATLGWGTMRPVDRFDKHRKMIDILPVLSFEDPFRPDIPHSGRFFNFDFGIHGKANGYGVGGLYGVTDRIQIGVMTQFMSTEVWLHPIFQPGTVDYLGIATLDDMLKMLNLLGRPSPKMKYRSHDIELGSLGLDPGDTTVSVTWNYFRTSWFSTAGTLNINVPTAHKAAPNSNLTFGLGPDFDTGAGAWGIGASIPLDFRAQKLANWLSFGITGEGMIFFQDARKSPKFLPINKDVWDYYKAQGVDVDFFQDLTDMHKFYYYTPGPWAAITASIGLGPASISYRHGFGGAATYRSNSPGFNKMIDVIGLVGYGDDGKLIFSMTLPLTPLYIPGAAMFRFEYQTDGRNALIFRDRFMAGIGFGIPLNPPERYRMKRTAQ